MSFRLGKIGPSQNTSLEVTDPGLPAPSISAGKDAYISPEPSLWDKIKTIPHRKEILQELEGIAKKIERLADAPEEVIHYFLDHDFDKFIEIGQRHPKEAQKVLAEAIKIAKDFDKSEPWFLLAQMALNDHEAFLRAIELLG